MAMFTARLRAGVFATRRMAVPAKAHVDAEASPATIKIAATIAALARGASTLTNCEVMAMAMAQPFGLIH